MESVHVLLGTPVYLQGRRQREKLVCPHVLRIDQARRTCELSLSRQQLHQCPDAATDLPIGRQHTVQFAMQHEAWLTARLARLPLVLNWLTPFARRAAAKILSFNHPGHSGHLPGIHKSHLRSVREVRGYTLFGTDAQAGTLHDFALDLMHWRLIYASVRPSARHHTVRGTAYHTSRLILPVTWLVGLNWTFRCAKVNLPISAICQTSNGTGADSFAEQSVSGVTNQYLNLAWD